MPEHEPHPAPEPALPEAAHDHHEHGEHLHEHGTSGVLEAQTGCKNGCAKCLVCTRKKKEGE